MKEALLALELTAGGLKAPPIKRGAGDVAFALSFERRGADVAVKALSLQRPATIQGEGVARVLAVSNPKWQQRALVSALRQAIPRALEDLQARITGVRTLVLSVRVSDLDGKAREHAESTLLPCLMQLYSLTGPVTTPELKAGYLDEAIEYLPEKDEPREPLAWQVARVRDAMIGGPRSKCSVRSGPLQGWSPFVAADPVNGAVIVSFKR